MIWRQLAPLFETMSWGRTSSPVSMKTTTLCTLPLSHILSLFLQASYTLSCLASNNIFSFSRVAPPDTTSTASRGRGMSRGRGGGPRGCGRSRGAPHGSFTNKCQVCLKVRHTAATCWYRFDEEYVPEQCNTIAATSYGSDNNWYTDSDATNHITGELDKLTMHNAYNGTDQIHTANGTDMEITNVDTSIISTPCRNLVLNNVLHVPATIKSLISVHKFILDNDMFIEFHQLYFLIKDQKTRRVLLRRPCKGGLYPLPPLTSRSSFLVPFDFLLIIGVII
jgi:hypothetical protein